MLVVAAVSFGLPSGAASPTAPDAIVLVKDGVLQASVACGDSEPERVAASEYYRIIHAITGCATNAAAIAAAPHRVRICIAGDAAAVDSVVIGPKNGDVILGGNNPRSAGGAMYRFLEELGVRWYWPGAEGEYLPKARRTLVVRLRRVRETAAFKFREMSIHWGQDPWRFLAHQRTNPPKSPVANHWDWGFVRSWGAHSFGAFKPLDCKTTKEFFEHEPECFALRGGNRSKEQHCYTNPRTREIFLAFIDDFWKNHPDFEMMSLTAIDSPVYCTCPECGKYDSSTLYFRFVSDLVNTMNKKYPGKRYTTFAYSFYVNPPVCPLPDNLMVTYCQYNRCYKHTLSDPTCRFNARSLEKISAWSRVLGHMPEIYGYHYDAFKPDSNLFMPMWGIAQDELKRWRDGKVNWYLTEYYGTHKESRFSNYAFVRLMWNPDLDMKALMREFTDRVFGKAAPEMREYWLLMERQWRDSGCITYYFNPAGATADRMLTKDVCARVPRLFKSALAKLPEASREAREVREEFSYWQKWHGLVRVRNAWLDIAEKPDAKRLARLRGLEPGKVLYPTTFDVKKQPVDFNYVPEMIWCGPPEKRFQWCKDEGLLFGNHGAKAKFGEPAPGWVNYEVAFDFQIPADDDRRDFSVWFRWRGERFGPSLFDRVTVSINREKCGARVSRIQDPDGKLSDRVLSEDVRFAKPLGATWHAFRGRVIDGGLLVTVDGKTVLDIRAGVMVGRGMPNISSWRPLNVRGFRVRELATEGDPQEAAPGKDGNRPFFIDGNGQKIYY